MYKIHYIIGANDKLNSEGYIYAKDNHKRIEQFTLSNKQIKTELFFCDP